jgi:2-phosphosulfolactate phosphatase
MKFQRMSLETCQNATGIVVVIDVLRAFSTAAYAFEAGAKSIRLVSTVEEAFLLKNQFPDALLMGEVHGLPIEDFDYGNSPTQLAQQNLAERELIQRTTAGTQGVTHSINADILLASSFCCAKATVEYIRRLPERDITFIITGQRPNGRGTEDAACADYLEDLLTGKEPDMEKHLQRVRDSVDAQIFLDESEPAFPASDLEYCLDIDKFSFAMPIEKENGVYTMKPEIA